MRIQHNIVAMNAYRNYNLNNKALSGNLEKLSSGYKINRAGDDAAGLAISEKMRAQITGLNAASKNVKDGISLVKTAEGAMQEIQDMLNRMDYLATQSANGTYDNEVDRKNLQKEVDALRSEINRIADSANFNGIKLLDGSLDADSTDKISEGSAIQNLTVNDFKASGPSAAFNASYITNRPPAANKQTNASFTVKFDDVTVTKPANGTATFEVNIGGTTIEGKASAAGKAMTGAEIAAAVLKGGQSLKAGSTLTASANNATAQASGTGTAVDWKAALEKPNAPGSAAKYVEIGGHFYEMSAGASADEVTFTQVDFMGTTGGEVITPDFDVSFKAKNGDGTGTVNWKVQDPVTGLGIGATHQAQVDVTIDFEKLRHGDSLNVGDMKYTFKLTDEVITPGTAETVIDLSSIFKSEADFADPDKQALAMVTIANGMNAVVNDSGTEAAAQNNTWSVGNGGVADGVGKLTFQSLSAYKGDATTGTVASTAKSYIGGDQANGICDMTTEASVMKQFFSNSEAAAANVTFEVDVSKIKEGDTITVDGVTFEFTDGTTPGTKGNVAVDLSSLGLANGGTIPTYNTSDVLDALKTAIDTELPNKYTTTVDGNKVTLTSKDVAGTTAKEDRVAADVKLGGGAYEGKSLTLQIGDTSDDFNQLTVSIGNMHTAALGIDALSIADQDSAKGAIQTIKDAINYVSEVRGTLGATQNRLEHTANNLSVMAENIQDAESTIRDTDVAEEMMAYTKNNILIQSAQAMLAQANAVPQGVLQLLG